MTNNLVHHNVDHNEDDDDDGHGEDGDEYGQEKDKGSTAMSKTANKIVFLRIPSIGSDLLVPCISPTKNKKYFKN